MTIVDKTGRKLKIGQILDTFMLGIYQAKLIGIKDSSIMLSPQTQIPPHIILACSITPYIRPDGYVPDVYIIADANPNDPVVKEAEEKEKGMRIVRPS